MWSSLKASSGLIKYEKPRHIRFYLNLVQNIFKIKNEIEGQSKSSPKLIGILAS